VLSRTGSNKEHLKPAEQDNYYTIVSTVFEVKFYSSSLILCFDYVL